MTIYWESHIIWGIDLVKEAIIEQSHLGFTWLGTSNDNKLR